MTELEEVLLQVGLEICGEGAFLQRPREKDFQRTGILDTCRGGEVLDREGGK